MIEFPAVSKGDGRGGLVPVLGSDARGGGFLSDAMGAMPRNEGGNPRLPVPVWHRSNPRPSCRLIPRRRGESFHRRLSICSIGHRGCPDLIGTFSGQIPDLPIGAQAGFAGT